MRNHLKFVMYMVVGGFYCCAPHFIHAEVGTNAPVSTTPAPAPVTNHPPQVAPWDPVKAGSIPVEVPVTNQPPQAPPSVDSIVPLRKKAEAGDAESQFALGCLYGTGSGVIKNEAEALKWYRKSADQGNAQAQDMVGMCYHDGIGVPKDMTEGAKWTRKAADQGDAGGQYMLGLLYQEGWGVEKDLVEAAKWFRKAADQGNAGAQSSLGSCYTNGTGVDKDAVEAAKWYRKAAEQGDALAQYNLAVVYHTGEGVEKDMVEAAKWYRKAAEQGVAEAQVYVGISYLGGMGGTKDPAEAVKWFLKAADQGNANAQWHLGFCYDTGTGVEKDAVEAVKWLRKAADQGDAQAQDNLGVCYYNGDGVKKDPVEAAKWYRKAADLGNANAQWRLGFCYEKGIGVEKDMVESAKWYRKAADQGNALAQGEIGLLFIEGLGVIKNEVEGLAWLYVASANGVEPAAKVISSKEKIYSASIISAARDRATEIQAQIASHIVPVQGDSATALLPPAPARNIPKASGSGAFISADGLVITAAHVVQGAKRIEVITATGTLAATVVKIDASNDVALLKCTGSNFTPLPIAPSKEARAGKSVFTVGFPNIQLQGFDPKLTNGEISSQTGFQDDPRQWQISVPIQPGNSGGPLCDENGNLIGIVLATLDPLKMAKLAGEIPQNVNYAVKSSYILPLLDDVQNLPKPRGSSTGKFEDVVDSVRPSTVLILVY